MEENREKQKSKMSKTAKWGIIFIVAIFVLSAGSVLLEDNNDELLDDIYYYFEDQEDKIDIEDGHCYLSKFSAADVNEDGSFKWYEGDNELSYFYDTVEHTPFFKATYEGKELRFGKDYKVRFSDDKRKNEGTYEVYFFGKGDYKGAQVIEYEIKKGSQLDVVKQLVYDDMHVGYNQDKRDYAKTNQADCSSLVYTSLLGSGLFTKDQLGKLNDFRTRNLDGKLVDLGFKRMDFSKSMELKPADLLLFRRMGVDGKEWGHIATYMGNGNIAEAYYDENGNVRGGKDGDQTTQEVRIVPIDSYEAYDRWQYVYRLPEKSK